MLTSDHGTRTDSTESNPGPPGPGSGSPENSLASVIATWLPVVTQEEGKKYGNTNLMHVHRGFNGMVLRNHDTVQ